jgi:hypothetical protein
VVLSPIEQRIKAKIEAAGTPLKDWDINIYRGILTGYNDAFIISGEKRKELIEQDPKSEEIIRPILRGRNIKRYGYEFADLYLLFVPWHFPLQNDNSIQGASEKAEKEFEKQYPAIYYHLLKYKKELSARNKAETGIRYEWYALQRWGANYWDIFLITNLGILETVNHINVGRFAFAHALRKFINRLAVKQQELPVYCAHAKAFQAVLHGKAVALFQAVVSHCAIFTQFPAQLHHKRSFSVAGIAPDKPYAGTFRRAKGFFPLAFKWEDSLFHAQYFLYT